MKNILILCVALLMSIGVRAYERESNEWIGAYNPCWTSQSSNSSESMPCGGGDVGMNVWVENDEVFLYLSRSGVFDENNVSPKLGRIRLSFSPNPFKGASFRQELILKDGYVEIEALKGGHRTIIQVWANVHIPVAEVKVKSDDKLTMTAVYETWRRQPLVWNEAGRVRASIAYRDAPVKAVIQPDTVIPEENRVLWYHRNREKTVFDLTVEQQHLSSVGDKLWNPLKQLTFGGYMEGDGMISGGTCQGKYIDTDFYGYKLISRKPGRNHHLSVVFHTAQSATVTQWKEQLENVGTRFRKSSAKYADDSRKWWNEFWTRSYVVIDSDSASVHSPSWQVGRNYQLFRYQLGCNAYGKLPTKFNGGLFTYDPSLVDKKFPFTPDHRDWGGGTHTAQNQRLVYWPMLKSGDFDMMAPQLDFYLNALENAKLRVKQYWGHEGHVLQNRLNGLVSQWLVPTVGNDQNFCILAYSIIYG